MKSTSAFPVLKPNRSHVRFHAGLALLRLAGDYHTLAQATLEQFQNAVDAKATKIWLEINRKRHTVVVRDNGNGTDLDAFGRALQSVCMSLKAEDSEAYGQFGQGLISPLGKCAQNTFTSRKRDGDTKVFTRWTFVTDDIERMADNVIIPHRVHREDIDAPWNTEVRLVDTVPDGVMGRIVLDELIEEILERFNVVMLSRPVWVYVTFTDLDGKVTQREFTGRKFAGKKLPDVMLKEEHVGDTLVRLYIAPLTTRGRKGVVQVGVLGNPHRFSFAKFLKAIDPSWLSPDTVEVLTSRLFEGEILGRKLELHVGREKFVENDALKGFCETLDKWYVEHGQAHFAELQEAQQDDRYKQISNRTIERLAQLLRGTKLSHLMKVIQGFKFGTIGSGHVTPAKDKVIAPPALAVNGHTSGPSGPREEGGETRTPPKKAKENHHPFLVGDPDGRERKLVKNDSLGLMFRAGLMPGSPDLWSLDTEKGILDFNDRHPLWEACKPKDEWVARLELFCAIQALTLETMPPDCKDTARLAYDELISPFVESMILSATITGKKPGRKKTQ